MKTLLLVLLVIYVIYKTISFFSTAKRVKEKKLIDFENEGIFIKHALSSKNQCSDFKKFTKQLGRCYIDYTVDERVGTTGVTFVSYVKTFPNRRKSTAVRVKFTYTGQYVGYSM